VQLDAPATAAAAAADGTHERLLNDRWDQDNWLRRQLREPEQLTRADLASGVTKAAGRCL
jgi:hypothetical protein